MSTPSTLISIVTAVLNNRDGLKRTEESIYCQTSQELQWIVVDGGSQDGSIEILRNSKIQRLKWVSETDGGIYEAMNKGIQMSDGKYILFLNAGDALSDEEVANNIAHLAVQLLSTEQSAPVILGGVNLVLPQGQTVYRAPREIGYIWHSLPTSHQAMLFPSGFAKRNLYDTSYRVCGDYYIGALAYKLGYEFMAVSFPIVNFEVGGFSYQHPLTMAYDSMRVQRSVLQIGYLSIAISALYRIINTLGLRLLVKVPSLAALSMIVTNMLYAIWRRAFHKTL